MATARKPRAARSSKASTRASAPATSPRAAAKTPPAKKGAGNTQRAAVKTLSVEDRLAGLARHIPTGDDELPPPRAAERSSVERPAKREASAPPSNASAEAVRESSAARAMPDPMAMWSQWMSAWMPTSAAPTTFPAPTVAPASLLELQQDYAQRLTQLWNDFVEHPEKVSAPIGDTRFADTAWQKSPLASFTARAYLLNAEFLNRMADSVEGDDKTRGRVKFAMQQWVEAAAPSNFLALNPKAQQRALETKGESLKAGLDNLLKDVAQGKISQSDESAFEVGRNVATTEGMVVYENALIQLIQYSPLTPKVRARPFVIVPPCINKFYILDLQPENSFIRYCVAQGNTVFVVSWKNPHESERDMTWDDYIELGPIAAMHVARDISGADQLNVLGFCVGGTIIATALAVLAARGENIAASLTLLTALLDFQDTGVLDIFIDESHVRLREQTLGGGGLMPGKDLANTFSSLRPNDLVWNYVVANYLEGRTPPAFDLLYWNGDSTNLPGPMYAWYLRNMYLENSLKVPNKLTVCGQKIDLGRLRLPTYVFAAREDHIVPWKAGYRSALCIPGNGPGRVRYVLGASGHIAGTINPAGKNKRSFWRSNDARLPADPDAWLAKAEEVQGSWWRDWDPWLAQFAGGEKVAPTRFGNSRHQPIEPAPGRYVKEKA